MSFVADQVRRVDGQLDRLQFSSISPTPASPSFGVATDDSLQTREAAASDHVWGRIGQLQAVVKALSTTSSPRPLLGAWRIQTLLDQAHLSSTTAKTAGLNKADVVYQRELEWLLVSKATAQTYGLILNALLDQTIPLSNDIWYWDEVLGSNTYTGLYTVQTSPLRFWQWSKDVYQDARQRLQSLTGLKETDRPTSTPLSEHWKQFYGLVKDSIRDRSIADMRSKVLSPFAMCRAEARRKQDHLKRLREMSASGLGVLMDEGLTFDVDEEGSITAKGHDHIIDKDEWKSVVVKSIALMETVLRNVTTLEIGVVDFEDTVFTSVDEDPELLYKHTVDDERSSKPALLANRLEQILSVHVPSHTAASRRLVEEYGRPSIVVRYWLPATALLLSSSTLLRIFVNRKADITAWVRDFGTTVMDFWYNWVVEPVKKVVGTIRHDEDSEVAIMSKRSLEGDRASLERMVVDFAVDNPDASGGPLNESQIEEIRVKVKEGDLTPVLRAYERDLRRPFMGTLRGDLVRALLIQIQKTKVDVEVAISGIDALLKSQELVFGFVGLTPGILVCLGVGRWLSGLFGNRKGVKRGKTQSQMVRVLRNIDRIMTSSTPSNNGMLLSYKDHGLLLCEVHVLRQIAQRILPGEIYRELLEEVNDLVDIRTGVERQLKVVDRIRWAYAQWLR